MSIIADADLDCLEFDMSLDKVTLCRALTFNERAELLRQAVDAPAVDVALAKQRLQRWTSQRPFEDASLFLRRLDADHLSADEFEHVLGLNEQALGRMSFDTPQWAQAIEHNLARLSPHADWSQSKGFADVVAPLVHDACDIVHDSLATLFSHAHVRVVDLKVIEDQLLAELHSTLRGIFTKTMVLELNVARVQGQLTGDTPEARFWSFVARLHEPIVVRALIDEYPVMFRLLAEAVARWTRISTEPLQRLCTDWHAIRAQFCDGDVPGALVKLRTGLGTARVGGRSVAIFTFESGFRVVYKPKSMSAELHFQELLAWMNERGAQPTFRPLRILDRGSHSWMEWVQATTCKSPQQVAHFYRRQGAYLGLLYALDATDFHQDNLIAADEHPLLIDLEALFHPHSRANADIDADADAPAQSLEGALQRVLSHSVLRTSLLPRPEIANDESDGYDDSGLTGSGTTLTPYEVSTWDNVWTDEMKLVRKRVQASSADNLPTLDGAPIDVLVYYDDIVSGFESSYRLLLRHRSALLAADGPLARFADDDTRVMLHSNDTYDRLLSNSTHPDLLRDALDRDRYLDRLWVAAAEDARMVDVIPLETRDLLVGDMPVFAARPGSRDLFAGDGQRIDEFFQCSGLERSEDTRLNSSHGGISRMPSSA